MGKEVIETERLDEILAKVIKKYGDLEQQMEEEGHHDGVMFYRGGHRAVKEVVSNLMGLSKEVEIVDECRQ